MNETVIIIKKLKENLPSYRNNFKVKSLGIFGSYISGTPAKESDVDILVEFEKPVSLFEFLDFEEHLSELIGKKVDLVMKGALKPEIGKHILKEVQYI